jgi:hypothetical protein
VEDWLVGFRGGALAALTPAALAEYASAVAANLEEPPKRLTEEAGPMWSEIVQRRYRWDHAHLLRVHPRPIEPRSQIRTPSRSRWDYAHRVAAAARELTVEGLLAFFDRCMAHDAPERRLAVSHAFSPAARAAADAAAAPASTSSKPAAKL